MGCGCKNKNGNGNVVQGQQASKPVQQPKQTTPNAGIQESIKKVVEKYYKKR